ncbi:MAG: hypothetical protein EXR79_05535 [Myxococcales bacterium]|nr:hypothetical protein [Myxococcales bacterium]
MSSTAIIALVGVVVLLVLGVVVMKLAVKLLVLVAVGLAIGALARWALPGRQEMSWLRTAVFGMAGSLAGGLVAHLIGRGWIVEQALAVATAAALIAAFDRNKALPPG